MTGPFCISHSILSSVLLLASDKAVLYKNVALSIVVLDGDIIPGGVVSSAFGICIFFCYFVYPYVTVTVFCSKDLPPSILTSPYPPLTPHPWFTASSVKFMNFHSDFYCFLIYVFHHPMVILSF